MVGHSGTKRRPFVSGLLLAAGTASRFGRAKQLEQLEGVALAERALDSLASSGVDEVVVVLGHEGDRVRDRLSGSRARFVTNPEYQSGLSSSVKRGIDALDKESEGVLIVLADQPFVTTRLIDEVVERFRVTGATAVAAVSGDLVSPPVLLSKGVYGRVRKLEGDKGAKAVLMSLPYFERVETEPDELLDIDTEAEMSRARDLLKEKARGAGGRARGLPSSKKSSSPRGQDSHRSG